MERKSILSINDFIFNKKYNIYQNAKSGCTINYSDGYETEKYIFDSIKKAEDITSDSQELTDYIKNWPSCYHLNINRPNIMRALNLPGESMVLEIGSGCGAITRYLGEHFKQVDAIEGSEFRAAITRERCRDLNNVTVYNTNINCINLPRHNYDVITLIGVLEYAGMYMDASPDKAPVKLLNIVSNSLSEKGIAVIAIENKLGLKYWDGAPEDHVKKEFEGINDYPSERGPVTFTKSELVELLTESGFKTIKFFSCFPDYKFATTIVNNEKLKTNYAIYNWIEFPFSMNGIGKPLFHEGLALKTVCKGNLFEEFANSFLVIASKETSAPLMEHINWISKRFSLKRRPEFRTVTTFKGDNIVEKSRISGAEKTLLLTSRGGLKVEHNVSKESWIEGELLTFKISKFLFQEDFKEKLLSLVKKYHTRLMELYSLNKFDKYGYPYVAGEAFDFIFRNIMEDKNGVFNQIDMEWDVSPITADFVLYRALKNDLLIAQNPWIKKYVKNKEKFIVEVIKSIYPQYNRKRFTENLMLDRKIGNLITANKKYSCPVSKIQEFKRSKIIVRIWHMIPKRMRVKILTLMQRV